MTLELNPHHLWCAVKWKIDIERLTENSAIFEPITEKQVRYIGRLNQNVLILEQVMNALNYIREASGRETAEAVEDVTKAEGMYIIKCLTREIKPFSKEQMKLFFIELDEEYE